jgi:myo-inositol-1(or 4)-monophosphatase
LVYVACGKFNGFFEYSLAPWDVAAGAIIVKEAGGIVTDFNGGQDWLHGKSIVVGSPNIQNKLLEIIQNKSK